MVIDVCHNSKPTCLTLHVACKLVLYWPSPNNQGFYRQIVGYQRGVGDRRVGQR